MIGVAFGWHRFFFVRPFGTIYLSLIEAFIGQPGVFYHDLNQ